MKKIVLAIIFIFIINSLKAQSQDKVIYKQNWDKQTVFWGYYLGLNMKDYKITYEIPNGTFIDVTPSTGFNVGLIGDLRIHKNINLRIEPSNNSVEIEATVKTNGQTGVEMEALTAANITALTIYDMVKAIDKTMKITDLRVTFKDGGKTGQFVCE